MDSADTYKKAAYATALADDDDGTYAWKSEPDREVVVETIEKTSMARTWRLFLAGAIMGVATLKAAQLIFKRDKV